MKKKVKIRMEVSDPLKIHVYNLNCQFQASRHSDNNKIGAQFRGYFTSLVNTEFRIKSNTLKEKRNTTT